MEKVYWVYGSILYRQKNRAYPTLGSERCALQAGRRGGRRERSVRYIHGYGTYRGIAHASAQVAAERRKRAGPGRASRGAGE